MRRADLDTPALILDRPALAANIAAMAARVAAAGVALRPHAKTHKSVDIARLQRAAGAIGQCCARVGEAEILAAAGIPGLLVTSPATAPAAIGRLAALAARAPDLMAVVDHPAPAAALDEALAARGASIAVLIDIDPGLNRTGVASPEAAVALAQAVARLPRLRLAGVQFYCGMEQHLEAFASRAAILADRYAVLDAAVAALGRAGFPPAIVSGGGTGSHAIDLASGRFTELQAGSYIVMDRHYLDCALTADDPAPFAPALFVDATVVSANHPTHVTIDAGYKALAADSGPARLVDGPADTGFAFMGDEHSALIGADIAAGLRPGDRVSLVPPHCDPTINLHDHYHLVEGDRVVDRWPVSARGHPA